MNQQLSVSDADRKTFDSASKAETLIAAIQALSASRTLDDVAAVVRHSARLLVDADGATFVIRDGGECFYADEDAIAPLWKGRRFPIDICLSGWVMNHRTQVALPNIYEDPRVPQDAYRATFVKSLVLTPIRKEDPVGAIGVYWQENHEAIPEELRILQNLADSTALAIANVMLLEDLERRVADRTKELQTLNEGLQSFAYAVSHDLRSPLSGIGVLAQAICDQPEGGDLDTKRMMRMISSEAFRMSKFTEALLLLYSSTAGEMVIEEVDVSEIAVLCIDKLRAQEPNRTVEVSIEEHVLVRGDRSLLYSLIANLIGNAWKYSSQRSVAQIRLFVSACHEDAVTIAIADNGCGFDSQKLQASLFAPFKRYDPNAQFEGTGVGLSTAKKITDRHNGKIWTDSTPGQGTTFFVTLPQSSRTSSGSSENHPGDR